VAVFTTQLYDELRSLRIDVSTTVIKSNAKELLSTFQAAYGFFRIDRSKLLPAWVPCHKYQYRGSDAREIDGCCPMY